MRNDIFLTIGIPTFNGATYLPSAINSVIRELPQDIDSKVKYEILISDNASTDNTKQIILNFQKKYPGLIRYYCNDSNLGYDRNVDLLIQKSNGRYVKLLGDDDELLPNSLKVITDQISQNPELIVLVHSVKFINIKTNQIIESDHKIFESKVFNNGDEFFQKSKWASAALSSLVVSKSFWINSEIDKYFGTHWVHIGGLIEMLINKGKSIGISEQLTLVRLNNDRWENNFGLPFVVGITHLRVLQNLLVKGYKNKSFSIFLIDRFEHNHILGLRSNSIYVNVKTIMCLITEFWSCPKLWLVHIPLFIFGEKLYLLLKRYKPRFK